MSSVYSKQIADISNWFDLKLTSTFILEMDSAGMNHLYYKVNNENGKYEHIGCFQDTEIVALTKLLGNDDFEITDNDYAEIKALKA